MRGSRSWLWLAMRPPPPFSTSPLDESRRRPPSAPSEKGSSSGDGGSVSSGGGRRAQLAVGEPGSTRAGFFAPFDPPWSGGESMPLSSDLTLLIAWDWRWQMFAQLSVNTPKKTSENESERSSRISHCTGHASSSTIVPISTPVIIEKSAQYVEINTTRPCWYPRLANTGCAMLRPAPETTKKPESSRCNAIADESDAEPRCASHERDVLCEGGGE